MTNKEFMQYTQEIENFYGQKLSDVEKNVWYENLKFMTIERFNYIIAEIYKTNKFMPKLAEILEIHKSLGYTTIDEQIEVEGDCKKCGDTGYVTYTKIINNMPYTYVAVCDCGRQKRYDGKQCTNPRNRSDYYVPTLAELGIDIRDNKPTKQQVKDSMMKLKDSPIMPESIKEIIRKEFVRMEG